MPICRRYRLKIRTAESSTTTTKAMTARRTKRTASAVWSRISSLSRAISGQVPFWSVSYAGRKRSDEKCASLAPKCGSDYQKCANDVAVMFLFMNTLLVLSQDNKKTRHSGRVLSVRAVRLFGADLHTVAIDITFGLSGNHEAIFHVHVHQVVFGSGLHGLVILPDNISQLGAGDHFGPVRREGESIPGIKDMRLFIDHIRRFRPVRCLYVVCQHTFIRRDRGG